MSESLAVFVLRRTITLRPQDDLATALARLRESAAQVILLSEPGQLPQRALAVEQLPGWWLEGVATSTPLAALPSLPVCCQPIATPWLLAAEALMGLGAEAILVVHDAARQVLGALRGEELCAQTGLRETADLRQGLQRWGASAPRLRAMLDASQAYLSLLSPEGTVLEINAAMQALAPFEPLIGRPLTAASWWRNEPAQQEKIAQAVRQAASGREVALEITLGDGGAVAPAWVDFAVRPVFDGAGRLVYLLTQGWDVTARHQAQCQLAEEHAVLRTVLDTIPDLISFKDANSVYRGCNQAFEKLFGRPEAQIVGRTDFYFVDSELATRFRDRDQRVVSSNEGSVVEEWVRYPDGRRALLETARTPIRSVNGQAIGVLGVARDITEGRRLDEALRQSQERYRRLFENMTSGFMLLEIVLDLTGRPVDARFLEVNPAYEQMVGRPASEIVGRTLRELHPETEGHWLEVAGRVALSGAPANLDKPLLVPGHLFSARLFCPQRGQFAGIVTDVTERRRAEVVLARQKAQLRAILDNFPFMVWLKDRDGHYLDANYEFARSRGLSSPDALLGKTDYDFFPDTVAAHGSAEDREVMDSLERKVGEMQTGEPGHWEEFFKTPILDESGALLGTAGFARDISERKRDEEALRASQAHYQALLDVTPVAVLEINAAEECVYANQRCLDMLGCRWEDLQGVAWLRLIHPEDRDKVKKRASRRLAEGQDDSLEVRLQMPDGRQRWVLGRSTVMPGHNGESGGEIAALLDITERKKAESHLKLAASIYEACGEGVMVLDGEQRIASVNPAFTTLLGYEASEVLGCEPSVLGARCERFIDHGRLWYEIENADHWQGEIWSRRKDGAEVVLWMTLSTLRHADGSVQWRFALFSDITSKKQAEEIIWHQANYDALTGLPNRRLFRDRLQSDIRLSQQQGQMLAVLFIDLDYFKCVNDTLGHDCGDRLLAEVARRLQCCVGEADTVARLGGDEFTVILPALPDVDGVAKVAEAIIAAQASPFELDGELAHISASVGIAVYPRDGEDEATLFKQADRAMYFAKAKGRNAYSFVQG